MFRSILTTLLCIFTAHAETAAPESEVVDGTVLKKLEVPAYLVSSMKISKETESLLIEHGLILDNLIGADAKAKELVKQAHKWEQELNILKKGEIDALKDKAERLATSNELRRKIITQLQQVSSYVNQLKTNRELLREQRIKDEKRWAMEAYKLKLQKLEEEKILEHQLKLAAPLDKKTTRGKTLSEENVQYETVQKDRTLQDIAWQYYNDNEKWKVIYNYPGNKEKISEESPSALIPTGTILTIPNIDEE